MKKIFFLICASLIIYSCSKENDNVENEKSNIVVANGKLSDVITTDNIYTITNLTINGTISGEDWNTLFEMATMGKLELLDMTNAKIVGVDNADWWNDDEIPEYEFSQSKTLKEVYLPSTLKVIGTEAFAKCTKLATVHFPKAIDSIAARAFYQTSIAGELELPSSLRTIGRQAFAYTNVSKVVITSDIIAGKTITQKENEDGTISYNSSIYSLGGNSVFAYCENLSEVVVKDGCTMLEIGFQHCSTLTKVFLPNTLRQIGQVSSTNGNYIFKDCSNLKSITLPDGLTFIGYSTFANTSFTEIEIPDNVQYLGTYAFHKCDQLKSVKMPQQLKQIDHGCFEGCSSLLEIDIPSKVTEIDYKAFADCLALKQVSFGDNITIIGRFAFNNCLMLQTALLPSRLSSLGESAFEGCRNLSIVSMSDGIEEIESSTFKDCVELHEITIGGSVTKIGSSAFFHCPKLETINLPSSITNIDYFAFAYTGIKEMSVNWSSPLPIASNTFDGINLSKATLKVPIGTTETYHQSSVWKDFGQIMEKE